MSDKTTGWLARPTGQFFLAWATAMVVSQGWLVYALASPQVQAGGSFAMRYISSMELVVAVIAAIALLVVAQQVERLFVKRQIGNVRAALWYLLGLGGIGAFGIITGLLISTLLHDWVLATLPMGVALAAFAATPVAVVARLIYPALVRNQTLALATIGITAGLVVFSAVGAFLLPR